MMNNTRIDITMLGNHEDYFPVGDDDQLLTSANSIIYYLENTNDKWNGADCTNYVRYE